MPRKRRFVYIADGLTDGKAAIIKKSLSVVKAIHSVQITPSRSSIEVEASRDVEDQIRLACGVAGARFRAKMGR